MKIKSNLFVAKTSKEIANMLNSFRNKEFKYYSSTFKLISWRKDPCYKDGYELVVIENGWRGYYGINIVEKFLFQK